MSNLVLFLGSGVSYCSGTPGVGEVTQRLLNQPYHRTTIESYAPGPAPSMAAEWYSAGPLQGFLRIAADYTKDFLNRRRAPDDPEVSPNYEDLYYICDQVHDDLVGTGVNPAVHEFTGWLREATESIVAGHPDPNYRTFSSFIQQSRIFIPSVVWHALSDWEVEPRGLDLVADLGRSPQFARCTVVTLNHDTLVERVLERDGVPFEDGFGDADGSVRWYEPHRLASEGSGVRVIKPHGSLNWNRFRANPASPTPDVPDRYGIHVGDDIHHSSSADGTDLLDLETVPLFLSGTGKESLYNSGIYGDMFDAFLSSLREADCMVMSGFGWNDAAIASRNYTWLRRYPDKRLVLLHENPIRLWTDSRAGGGLLGFARDGQVVVVRKWLQNATLDDVLSALEGSPA